MTIHRDVAIAAMSWQSKANDFMSQAGKPMPELSGDAWRTLGALPVMVRETAMAPELNMPIDVTILWGIGEFGDGTCSTYYDPGSPWYNVFYGGYAFASHKPDGVAW